MSLLFMDSFDAGDYAAKWLVGGGGGGLSVSVNTPFGVGRSVQKTFGAGGSISRSFTPSSSVIVGFWFSFDTTYSGFGAGIMGLRGDAGVSDHLTLATGDAANSLMLKRGDRAGTVLATVTSVAYGWHFCEIKATIADSGGTCEVRLDGTTIINYTGDTKNAGTSTNIDTVAMTGSGNSTNINILLKDLYVLNTSGSRLNNFLGPRRVYTLVATGAGASTALTPSAGANWACTDELPASQTDYVTGLSGTKDTYDVSDLPATVASADAVQVNVVGKRIDASAISVKPVLRSGGTDYVPSTGALGTVDTTVLAVHETDPATSAVWTLSGVNAIQHGVEVA